MFLILTRPRSPCVEICQQSHYRWLKAITRISSRLWACRRQLAKLSPWVKSQSQFNPYTSIRRPLSVFYSTNFSSILPIGWAKLGLFAVDKEWGGQPSLLWRRNIYFPSLNLDKTSERHFRVTFTKVVKLLYHWVSAFANEEILLTKTICLAGCKRRSKVRSALWFVGYGKINISTIHWIFNITSLLSLAFVRSLHFTQD